jgi:hypothetical protein
MAGQPKKTITFRLELDTWRELKLRLVKNGQTLQRSFEEYVDAYIEADGPPARLSEGDEGGVVAENRPAGGRAQKPETEGDSRTPSEQSSLSESPAGCQDHQGSPKAWCLNCQREKVRG